MAVTYTCDVCKKKIKEAIPPALFTFQETPYKHLCQNCWLSVVRFLKKREKEKKNLKPLS